MKRSTSSPRKNGANVPSVFETPRAPFGRVLLTIPWQHLVPDNQKFGVMRGRMLLRAEYRQAKDTIKHLARRGMVGITMAEGDLVLHAKLYMPDARRRDATNYAKLVQDSLQDVVYADDTQIKVATWENAGLDRANPRCEITVTLRAHSEAA